MEKITFIIPIYNVEEYLPQCLDSILYQTRVDHRAILVDDGSRDNSGAIADAYAARNPSIFKVIHQENGGLAKARNVGMQAVETEYFACLDSDDWLMPNYVELFEERLPLFAEQPDVILTLPNVYDHTMGISYPFMDHEVLDELFPSTFTLTNHNKNVRLYALEPNANRRIIRTAFAREIGLSFPVGYCWEDVQPHFKLFYHARYVGAIRETGFYYRTNRAGQITGGSGASRLQVPEVFDSAFRFAREQGWSVWDIAYIVKMMMSFTLWSLGMVSREYLPAYVDAVNKLFSALPKDYFKAYRAVCGCGRKERLYILAFRHRSLSHVMKDGVHTRYLFNRAKHAFHMIKRG